MTEKLIDVGPLMEKLDSFHRERIGIDGTLADFNTPEYLATRGIIGETVELLGAMAHGTMAELHEECADVLIFTIELFASLGLTPEEINQMTIDKITRNERKYRPEYFEGQTIREGLLESRRRWSNSRAEYGGGEGVVEVE